jgi:NTP pyrophosphatase (non-canonical NTP hydrolase)
MSEELSAFQKEISERILKVGGYETKSLSGRLAINSLALVGEAGEIANKIKKHIWYSPQGREELRKDIKGELGDVMYHVAQLATELNLDLNSILEACLEKTRKKEQGG